MKKVICMLLALLVCAFSLSACANEAFIKNYGTSELYTRSDMNAAVRVLMHNFHNWEDRGCRMIEVKYAGDAESEKNLDYCNSITPGAPYDACIVFVTAFRTPAHTAALNPNDFYTGYTWCLARTGIGAWKVVACGYA